MKRLLVAIALFGSASGASANPDLAQEWSHAASDLYVETVHALEGGELPASYEDSLVRFSVNAARLSTWVEKSGGPGDLGCIFRGMSREAEDQLFSIGSEATKAVALRRLATMFYDAEKVALAAMHANATSLGHQRAGAPTACVGSPEIAVQYLTEQP